MKIHEKQLLNILSLEDSLKDFEIICELLIDDEFDFIIERVENQNDFIDSLKTKKFSIILSDFSLPNFNAFGALEQALNICPEIPFIVISGSIGEETAIELVKKGASDYILKDKPDRLLYAVKRAFEESKEIMARKQVEEILAHERYLMNMLMDNVPDHIYFKDKESRIIRINKSYATSIGMNNPNETIGKTDFDFFDEQHAAQAFEDEKEIMKTGIPMIGIEEKETILGKTERWVNTTKMPLRDKTGETIGTFGISKDITERKKAEKALLKKIDELEHFHRVTTGRELKMIELKNEINSLLKKYGEDERYFIIE